jgi:WNK lysine deficient protein kinase
MVEELDLTDQDVSAIAEMIDLKIHSPIPDWTPRELPGDSSGGEVSSPDCCASEAKDDASPSTNEPVPSGSFSLEKLTSGRKFWSDSPKALGGASPKSGLSVVTVASLTGDNENSPDHEDTNNPDVDDIHEQPENECVSDDDDDDNSEEKEAGSEAVKIIAEKLENLLMKQQQELNELKRKHELAISDLLKGVPPEIHQKVLNACKQKILDH